MTKESIVVVDSLHTALRLFNVAGIKVRAVFPFLSALFVETNKGADELSALPFVRSAHINCRVKTADIKTEAADKIRAAKESAGTNRVTVAVIDTGVCEHPDLTLFRNRIIAFADFVGGAEVPYDDNGHGTAVAGVLCGGFDGRARPNRGSPNIAAVKALDAFGAGNAIGILQAMQWVYANARRYGIKVVNMSFGCEEKEGEILRLGAEALVKNGITVVASAGNGGREEGILSPATSPFVITVGGADGLKPAAFSAVGKKGGNKPDVVANAVDVPTLALGDGYTFVSGTSVAAPQVSALAARILSRYPDATPDRVKSVICSGAVALDAEREIVGHGLVYASLFHRL